MLARAPQADSQAWLLNQLGITLTRRGRHDEALNVLDMAVELGPSPAVALEAYAWAVTVHCAAGDLETADAVAATARMFAADGRLAEKLAEVYLRIFRETGQLALLDEAFACFQIALLEDARTRPS